MRRVTRIRLYNRASRDERKAATREDKKLWRMRRWSHRSQCHGEPSKTSFCRKDSRSSPRHNYPGETRVSHVRYYTLIKVVQYITSAKNQKTKMLDHRQTRSHSRENYLYKNCLLENKMFFFLPSTFFGLSGRFQVALLNFNLNRRGVELPCRTVEALQAYRPKQSHYGFVLPVGWCGGLSAYRLVVGFDNENFSFVFILVLWLYYHFRVAHFLCICTDAETKKWNKCVRLAGFTFVFFPPSTRWIFFSTSWYRLGGSSSRFLDKGSIDRNFLTIVCVVIQVSDSYGLYNAVSSRIGDRSIDRINLQTPRTFSLVTIYLGIWGIIWCYFTWSWHVAVPVMAFGHVVMLVMHSSR